MSLPGLVLVPCSLILLSHCIPTIFAFPGHPHWPPGNRHVFSSTVFMQKHTLVSNISHLIPQNTLNLKGAFEASGALSMPRKLVWVHLLMNNTVWSLSCLLQNQKYTATSLKDRDGIPCSPACLVDSNSVAQVFVEAVIHLVTKFYGFQSISFIPFPSHTSQHAGIQQLLTCLSSTFFRWQSPLLQLLPHAAASLSFPGRDQLLNLLPSE